MIPLSTYLKHYKVGDMVDVVAHGAVQKGMVSLKVQHNYAFATIYPTNLLVNPNENAD